MLLIFSQTVGFSFLLLVGLAAGLTWLNDATLQRLVNRTGTASPQLWLARPGLLFHELAHAVVGRLFGLRIAEFSLRADARSAGHVTFRLKRHALWQRLGLFWAAGAPVWAASLVILLLGKRAWWAGQPWAQISWQTLTPRWGWVAAWVVVCGLLSLGASLSSADFKQMLAGAPVAIGLLVGLFGLMWWLAPDRLTVWWGLNQAAFAMSLGLLGVSAVLAGLVRRL
ncbi:hypothetical protein [Lacticaseibacillus daqingensis]|uniref:hypothetical protein n=1 Tax=Lacticaseibacillus daqingensis TaxID=2486014 RepID=UPI000F79F97F|nr:hypothetical protein [Lacticaseibacillus daqingensis]